MRSALALAVIVFAACTPQPGLWQWRHPDPVYAEQNYVRDIDQCEQHAVESRMNHHSNELYMARDYGGWGDFPFEFCMRERGWHLKFVQPEP